MHYFNLFHLLHAVLSASLVAFVLLFQSKSSAHSSTQEQLKILPEQKLGIEINMQEQTKKKGEILW